MKFTEIAIFIFVLILSLKAVSMLGIIPTGQEGVEAITGSVTTKFNFNEDGTIDCTKIINGVSINQTETLCKIQYLNESQYTDLGTVTDASNLFGFSDILKGVTLLGDIMYNAVFRLGEIYDYYIPACNHHVVMGYACSEENRNPVHKIKWLIIIPIMLIYFLALFEVITGRQISGNQ